MFNHNRLDEYKKAMEVLGLHFHFFGPRKNKFLEIYEIEGYKYFRFRFEECDVKSEDWEEFKEKVANYFLNK